MTTQPNFEQSSSFAVAEASSAIPRIRQPKTTKTKKRKQWNPIWKLVLQFSLAVIWYGLCELYQEYETKLCLDLDNEKHHHTSECRDLLKKYYSDTSSRFRITEWARSTSIFGSQLPCQACLVYQIVFLPMEYHRFIEDQTLKDLETEENNTTDITAPSYRSLYPYGVDLNAEKKTREPEPQQQLEPGPQQHPEPEPQQQLEPEPTQQLLEPQEQQELAGPILVSGSSKQPGRVTRSKSHKNPSQGRTEAGSRPRRHSDLSYGNADQSLNSRSFQEDQTDVSRKKKKNK